MNRRHLLQLTAAGIAASALPRTSAQPGPKRHVIVISIDGLASYALNDKSVPLPTLRRLAAAGAIAEGSEVVNPAVTWPNHTAIITGVTPSRHLVLYNGLPVRPAAGVPLKVEPWVDKPELVKAPTLYDVAHAAGMTTAEVDWVAIHNAATITWPFPERPRMTDTIVKEMIAAGTVTEEEISTFLKAGIVWRDDVWTLAGEHIIEKHKPNLLLFHLLATDSMQHRYGARSLAGYSALALADAKVRRLLESVQRAGIAPNTAVFVVSDHGFKTYHNVIHPNAYLRQKGLLRDKGDAIDCDVWTIPEGGTAMVYVTRPELKAKLLPELRSGLSGIQGVRQVIGPEDYERLGFPMPEKSDRMADLVLAAADDYAFDGAHRGEVTTKVPESASPGAHGYLNTDRDMDSVFIASGAGIRRGVKLGRVRNIDVAPTAARVLGLEMKDVQGRVLTEALA